MNDSFSLILTLLLVLIHEMRLGIISNYWGLPHVIDTVPVMSEEHGFGRDF